jgi:hypothetical protein
MQSIYVIRLIEGTAVAGVESILQNRAVAAVRQCAVYPQSRHPWSLPSRYVRQKFFIKKSLWHDFKKMFFWNGSVHHHGRMSIEEG